MIQLNMIIRGLVVNGASTEERMLKKSKVVVPHQKNLTILPCHMHSFILLLFIRLI